ncbi:hypothetical protein SRHO_G00253700 [Serrasalmus rhombeus]
MTTTKLATTKVISTTPSKAPSTTLKQLILNTTISTTSKATTKPLTTTTSTTKITVPTTTVSNEPPNENEGYLFLRFRIIRVFIPQYYDPSSTEYKILEKNVTTELNRGYKLMYPLIFRRTILISFWPGSVGVTTQLIFDNQTVVPNLTNTEQSLRVAINESAVFLDIIPSSIEADLQIVNATTTNAQSSTATSAATTTTSKQTTTRTASQTSQTANTTSNSATARNRPKEVVTFLLPFILIYFLLTEKGLLLL